MTLWTVPWGQNLLRLEAVSYISHTPVLKIRSSTWEMTARVLERSEYGFRIMQIKLYVRAML